LTKRRGKGGEGEEGSYDKDEGGDNGKVIEWAVVT
jgi:hypothetical protein